MTTSVSNFKKRKSFISVTRRMSLVENHSFVEPLCPLAEEPEWSSLVLNASTFKRSSFSTHDAQLPQEYFSNKENIPINRPLIHIKPKVSTGLIWLKEGGRSDLIRLERESIYSYDEWLPAFDIIWSFLTSSQYKWQYAREHIRRFIWEWLYWKKWIE